VTTWAKGRQSFSVKGGSSRANRRPREIADLADLPPREVLLARMAGAFQAPLRAGAGAFGLPAGLANVLEQVRQQKRGGVAAACRTREVCALLVSVSEQVL